MKKCTKYNTGQAILLSLLVGFTRCVVIAGVVFFAEVIGQWYDDDQENDDHDERQQQPHLPSIVERAHKRNGRDRSSMLSWSAARMIGPTSHDEWRCHDHPKDALKPYM